ncbi:MAG: DUF6383 domain-containing protein [Parabacteroides gordonii]|nr:DUF6383 domain-containing protein [Parabacteroides gordonii]
MNKKFSTLVAGALLAGAVLTPSELLAQLQYAGGKTYSDVTTATIPTTNGKSVATYLIFESEEIPYVAVVENNALVAKPFLKANVEDIVNVKKIGDTEFEVYTSTGDNSGTAGGPNYSFGSVTKVQGVVFDKTAGTVKINYGTAYVTRDGVTFSMGLTSADKFEGKFVTKATLEAIENDRDVATELSFANNYILMVANKAIKGAADGSAELADYAQVQENFWSLEKVERGEHNAYALLKNKGTGKYLTIGGKQAAVTLTWNATDEKYELDDFSAMTLIDIISGEELPLTISGVEFSSFALCDVVEKVLSAEGLVTIFGDSFNAEMKVGNKTLENNPFTGNLKPVSLKMQGSRYTATVNYDVTGNKFMLQNGNGKIIAMQLTDKYANNSANIYGFKLVEVAPRDLALDLNKAAKDRIYAPIFSIVATEAFAVGKDQSVLRFEVEDIDAAQTYVLGSLTLSGKPTLSAEKNIIQYLDPISIKLGKFNTVDVKKLLTEPTFFTVTNKNTKSSYSTKYGKVLSVNTYGDVDWVKAADALVGYPQSQWAITVNDDASVLTFTNRENPSVTNFTFKASDLYNIKGETNVFAIDGDTIEIKPIATKESDDFLRLNNYKNEMYHVGVVSSVWNGVAYVAENHKEAHQLGLITDVEAATNWKLAPAMYEEWNSLNEQTVNRPDTLLIGSTMSYWSADDNAFVNTDRDGEQTVFLKVLAYSMQNNANKEYVMFDDSEGDGHYSTGTKDEGNKDDVYYYALKQVGTEKYNIVEVYGNQENRSMSTSKMYGGDSADKGILNRTYKYDQTENDVFTIEVADAAEYLKLNMGDVVKIFRDEFESNVLYEKGEFAGIGNDVEFGKINPALYVDTAYVTREGNNRWDYLLGVDVTRIDTTYKCNVPEHGVHHMDTTYGRFLVNLADSAIVEDERDNHSNKFVYDNGDRRYARLGFVEGMHTNDTLVIASTKDSIAVGTPEYSLAKFAFRIVDHSKNTFVIETGYKYPQDYTGNKVQEYPGYLRWINGNLVVTSDMDDAEVFTLKNDDRIPTANDEIAIEGVSVIAGNGSVTVKAAEGKNVVITNVLGQTIANTVITSSEATISAPAGVVVVAVEGEAAVKAIVK